MGITIEVEILKLKESVQMVDQNEEKFPATILAEKVKDDKDDYEY